ncbi:GGDEF-domain containing protein [filamentous cyanobacterium CCP5]|nr:GGDEF-domain containing protein [filamentous cyanobacterium CCP5]
MDSFSNGAIAAAYLILPLTLIPLLQTAHREIRPNLLLAIAFIFSCGVGHTLTALHLHSNPWHWVTAIVSWAAVIVLLKSQRRLRYLGESFRLLEATWEESITGKILFQRVGKDLSILKINPAGRRLCQNLLAPGDRLCEKMPHHRQSVYPYSKPLIELYLETLATGESQQLNFQYDGEISGWYLTITTALSPKLLYMTFSELSEVVHDPLTKLYNRRILDIQSDCWQSCIYIDLDRFKLINDRRGHQIGNQLLIKIAKVLNRHAQHHHGIAVRVGGDEFLLMLPQADAEAAYTVATAVLAELLEVEIQGASISASIGIASGAIEGFEEDGHISGLLQAAETALRDAKGDRHSDLPQHRIQIWNQALADRRLRHITLEAYLRQRQSEAEFWLAYQPICHMMTGKIIGAEALIRWNSAELGTVAPSEFIPVAENTGLIHRISAWVLVHALEQLAEWQQIAPEFTLSINISPVELEDNEFIEEILQQVAAAGIAHGRFGIEITERGIYHNLDRYLQSLQSLRDTLVRLKVDDFGMGQSGLAQLLRFRFDEVKVDRGFIPSGPDDLEKLAICRAITNLAEGIQFGLTAEGIEQEIQREMMMKLGYVYGQGYLFARPMPAAALTTLLQTDSRLVQPPSSLQSS